MNTYSSTDPLPAASAPAGTIPGVTHPKTIKSFVKRAGRMGSGQIKAREELGPKFLYLYQRSAIDFESAFADSVRAGGPNDAQPGTPHPVVLEIGFGMGEATAQIARALPDTRFLCCEVHEAGVGALLKRIGEHNITNIRICNHDAVEVIDHMLPPGCLDGVHIFFPDPWHKKKHNKRRLIQSPLIAKLAARIKPGGYIHCATDWQPYAEQILQVLQAEPLLKNTVPDNEAVEGRDMGYAPKPAYRPLTKFENRGIKLGHGVWDVVFHRV